MTVDQFPIQVFCDQELAAVKEQEIRNFLQPLFSVGSIWVDKGTIEEAVPETLVAQLNIVSSIWKLN